MSKVKTEVNIDFIFFNYLRNFYIENRSAIKSLYNAKTKKILDYNNPENKGAFLRVPQFEALEMYIFLKEYLENIPVFDIFDRWFHKKDVFVNRSETGMYTLFGELNEIQYKQIFAKLKSSNQEYSNYIFALTMGTGKTILMATCIFYEFILANNHPNDKRYCHNALVFAPDKTVLQSLKEIKTFDKSKVIPKEYINWLNANIKFHFMEESGTTLPTMDKSKYNIIISNTQKIILKKRAKNRNATDKLFTTDTLAYKPGSVYEKYKELYDVEDERDLISNQRFMKLTRLEQLGIYVDEAHHAFGDRLQGDLTSLRLTIDELHNKLASVGTKIVACYNYTGTPYVGNNVLPEVVYAYGLKDAITNKYLKMVDIHSYEHTKDLTFVRATLVDFFKKHKNKRYTNVLPKIAFFASTIDELQKELKPKVEKIMEELRIPQKRLLINVGDENITTSDEIREFNNLDKPESEIQIILLCNKGKEGWNCKSLFSVALFRRPKSKIFVLQSTMRCMRAIGDTHETADVHMTEENKQILSEELEANFRITLKELQNLGKDKQLYKIRIVPPPVIIQMKRTRKLFEVKEKNEKETVCFGLDDMNYEKYRTVRKTASITHIKKERKEEDISNLEENRIFTEISIMAEISRYLNLPCLQIEQIIS
jgi:hypothetical protein